MPRYPKLRISNRKMIFLNTFREISCLKCSKELLYDWVLSAPNERYRCLDCAVALHMIDEIPTFVKITPLVKI